MRKWIHKKKNLHFLVRFLFLSSCFLLHLLAVLFFVFFFLLFTSHAFWCLLFISIGFLLQPIFIHSYPSFSFTCACSSFASFIISSSIFISSSISSIVISQKKQLSVLLEIKWIFSPAGIFLIIATIYRIILVWFVHQFFEFWLRPIICEVLLGSTKYSNN